MFGEAINVVGVRIDGADRQVADQHPGAPGYAAPLQPLFRRHRHWTGLLTIAIMTCPA